MEFKMKYCPFCKKSEFVFDNTEVSCKSCGHLHDVKNGSVDYDYETVEIYCKQEGITLEEFYGTDKKVSQGELLPVEINENHEQTISGRMLHNFLEIKTAYKDWFPRMCEYGFVDGYDFQCH